MRLCALGLALLFLAGCGGGDERAETTPTEADPAPPPQIRGPPPIVPDEATGPAPPGAAAVVRSWAAAVREARFERAADLFARNARVQNGGAVERLKNRTYALVWNASLPCGATVESVGGADGYAIVRFRLTERRGGSCGQGRGRPARSAIKVREGRITEWYRLPDPPAGEVTT
jgi:hypothetical protein